MGENCQEQEKGMKGEERGPKSHQEAVTSTNIFMSASLSVLASFSSLFCFHVSIHYSMCNDYLNSARLV